MGQSRRMWPARRKLAVAAEDGMLSESLTLSAVVAGDNGLLGAV